MLNGNAVNAASINGSSGISLVLATATFAAGASFEAETTRVLAGNVNFAGGVIISFEGDQEKVGNWSVSAGPELVIDPTYLAAAKGDWHSDLTITVVSRNTKEAEVTFAPTIAFSAEPDARIGDGQWYPNAIWEIDPELTQHISGSWLPTSAIALDDAEISVDRRATADWKPTTALIADVSITSGGVTTHDGGLPMSITNAWENDPDFTELWIRQATWLGNAQVVEGTAYLTFKGKGQWSSSPTLESVATIIKPAEADWSMSGGFSSNPTFIVTGKGVSMEATAEFLINRPKMNRAGYGEWLGSSELTQAIGNANKAMRGSWTVDVTMTGEGERYRTAYANWATQTMVSMEAKIDIYGNAEWDALGNSTFSGAAVLSLVPAPTWRTFYVPYSAREFSAGVRVQQFEVAA